jgi:protein gp37
MAGGGAMTNIEWTDETWNPTRGCSRVSPGCGQGPDGGCYAERQAIRQSGPGGKYHGLVRSGPSGPRWTGRVAFDPVKLTEPCRWRAPRRVFVNSMSDLFHEALSDEQIAAVFGVMAQCPQHTFQILTKRAERMRSWFDWVSGSGPADLLAPPPDFVVTTHAVNLGWDGDQIARPWPLPNVHIGVSVESDDWESRIASLMQVPATVRFVSLEPLLSEPKAILGWIPGLDWVIVGGESGPRSRPFCAAWARSVVHACAASGVPCFVKQLGARPIFTDRDTEVMDRYAMALDAAGYSALDVDPQGGGGVHIPLASRKGGNPAEWPTDLRVRQWPRMRVGEP